MEPFRPYERRVIDLELDALFDELPAIAIDGPKGVGKTETATQRARTIYRLEDPNLFSSAQGDPYRLLRGEPPILIDEWQQIPASWDLVRRAVDDGASGGTFLLTGSMISRTRPTHSGAGRIVSIRMRPMTLMERGIEAPTVSLGALLKGQKVDIDGATKVDLDIYATEVVRSGFPGIRRYSGRILRQQLDGYIDQIVERDFLEAGHRVSKPDTLRRWMEAYAAASSTTASYEKIRDAATRGEGDKPAKTTTQPYRDVLERLWILDPVPAWLPSRNRFSSLSSPPKHQLADPALAAALLGIDESALLGDPFSPIPRDGVLFGNLFESLVTLSVRVYAQAAEARVGHLRTKGGRQEVDLIVERRDGRVVALEVKLNKIVGDADFQHLRWLREKIGDDLLDAVVVTTGPDAYRTADGIAVVPAALLGP